MLEAYEKIDVRPCPSVPYLPGASSGRAQALTYGSVHQDDAARDFAEGLQLGTRIQELPASWMIGGFCPALAANGLMQWTS